MSTDAVIIKEFRARCVNTLRGFVTVRLPSGIILHKCTVHQGSDSDWIGYPSRAMTDQDGIPVHDERGKIRYVNLVNFTTRARRDTLTQQILVALQRKHPEVFD